MRLALVMIFFALLNVVAAAERETLTLADGRTLVGAYDEAAGTIRLDGKATAIVKVSADQVKARAAAPALPEAPAKAASPEGASVADAPAEHVAASRDRVDRIPPIAILEEIERRRAEERKIENELCKKWVEDAHLVRIQVPGFKGKETQSEVDLHNEIGLINGLVDDAIRLHKAGTYIALPNVLEQLRDSWSKYTGFLATYGAERPGR